MGEDSRSPIKAATLRARDEWQTRFPDATVVWEETADEGVGHSFDGMDPSAMIRAMYRTSAPGAEVLQWYRELLEPMGWVRQAPRRDGWWEWRLPAQPGARFDVMDHGVTVEYPGWPAPPEIVGTTMFEVLFRVSTRPGVIPGESATFNA